MSVAFLSHSSKDKVLVEDVANSLRNFTNYDAHSFLIGDKTINEIFDKIENSDLFVFFISEDSLNSVWVRQELQIAEEKLGANSYKLKQILPIIIDDNINHNDARIPEFMRCGESSYNIKHFNNSKTIVRLIQSQLIKLNKQKNHLTLEKKNFFYGRHNQISKFIESYDCIGKNLKCMIVAGVTGIGKKTFIKKSLIDANVIKEYQDPVVISVKDRDGIDDIILKLVDVGYGNYSVPDISSLTFEEKMEIIISQLNDVVKYQEFLIIEDDFVLIDKKEVLANWFVEILDDLPKKLFMAITTQGSLSRGSVIDNEDNIFYIKLENMTKSESNGMFKKGCQIYSINYTEDDVEFFSPCFYGYPPQIRYVIQLASVEPGGLMYLKKSKKGERLTKSFEAAGNIVNLLLSENCTNKAKAFLKVVCDFETTPVSLIDQIRDLDDDYYKIFDDMIKYSVVYYIGTNDEYVRINPVLRDFISRNKYDSDKKIEDIISKNLEQFKKNVKDGKYNDTLSASEVNYYTREIVKSNDFASFDSYLYASIFIQSIIEAYNRRKYSNVVRIVEYVKESKMQHYLPADQKTIMYYYCMSLARLRNSEFESAVSFFNEDGNKLNYHFLRGFNYKITGKFDKAEAEFKKVLMDNNKHLAAQRDLVNIYLIEESFDDAYMMAKSLYLSNKDNIGNCYSYFECLLLKNIVSNGVNKINENDKTEIENIMNYVDESFEYNTKISYYYQMKMQYYAFILKDKTKVEEIFNEAISELSVKSYLLRDAFEIYEKWADLKKMVKATNLLEEEIKNTQDTVVRMTLSKQRYIIMAYKGDNSCLRQLELDNLLSSNQKKKIKNRIDKILKNNRG